MTRKKESISKELDTAESLKKLIVDMKKLKKKRSEIMKIQKIDIKLDNLLKIIENIK